MITHLFYPAVTSETLEWRITVKPNLACLIRDLIVLGAIGFAKPILLLAAVPACALLRLGEWKLAVWSLKRKKAKAAAAATEKLQEAEQPKWMWDEWNVED